MGGVIYGVIIIGVYIRAAPPLWGGDKTGNEKGNH